MHVEFKRRSRNKKGIGSVGNIGLSGCRYSYTFIRVEPQITGFM